MTYQELYRESIENKEKFWCEQAKALYWREFPKQILRTKDAYSYEWFSDGVTNMSYLALDHHINEGRGEQTSLIYDSASTGVVERYSYRELHEEVCRMAGVIQDMGLRVGDTCVIYMPMIPQAVIAMLACARLGVTHSVVFGGFAPHELAIRIEDCSPKLVISANYGLEFDKKIMYKPLLDEAIELSSHKPERCVIYMRANENCEMQSGRDIDWAEAVSKAPMADVTWVPSTHPLYVLYTSGTTGRPKGIVRDTGGYATALNFSMSHIYGMSPGETFWAASDVGWVVGHSYIVYGPLIHGCKTILFEGKPIRTPDAGTFWRVCADHGVKTMFTAPTAIRAIKKEDPEGALMKQYDLSELKYLFLAGERCDPSTYDWIGKKLNKPIIDHWWQTESGWPMLAISVGTEAAAEPRSGSSNMPVCGYDISILDENGNTLGANEEGLVSIKLPLPPGFFNTLWRNHQGFIDTYLSRFEGYYLSGDGGYVDSDGYYFIMGRVDDVINVAGHRLSTGEMEELLAKHEAIAECAVVGISDSLRGQRPIGLVVLKDGQTIDEATLEQETIEIIRSQIGAVAYYRNTVMVQRLPKTRSGKILRKTIRMIADEIEFQVPSTIDDPAILDEIRLALNRKQIGKKWDV